MNLTHFIRANELMNSALSGAINLGELEYELLSLVVDLDPANDPLTEADAGDALLVLAEMDRGDRSSESVRNELTRLVKQARFLIELISDTPSLASTTPSVVSFPRDDRKEESVSLKTGFDLRRIRENVRAPQMKPT